MFLGDPHEYYLSIRTLALISGHLRGFGRDHEAALEGLPQGTDVVAVAWEGGVPACHEVQCAKSALEAYGKKHGVNTHLECVPQVDKTRTQFGLTLNASTLWMWIGVYLAFQAAHELHGPLDKKYDQVIRTRFDLQALPGSPRDEFEFIQVFATDYFGSLCLPSDVYAIVPAKHARTYCELVWIIEEVLLTPQGLELVPEQAFLLALEKAKLPTRMISGEASLIRSGGIIDTVHLGMPFGTQFLSCWWMSQPQLSAKQALSGRLEARTGIWRGSGKFDAGRFALFERDVASYLVANVEPSRKFSRRLIRRYILALLVQKGSPEVREMLKSSLSRSFVTVWVRVLLTICQPLRSLSPAGHASRDTANSQNRLFSRMVPREIRWLRKFVLCNELPRGLATRKGPR